MAPDRRCLGRAPVLLIAVLAAGCHWGGAPAPTVPAGRDFLVEPSIEQVAAELVRRANDIPRLTDDGGPRRGVLPPLTPASRTWDAAALAWALLRRGPNLVPRDASQPSVAALQSWLRRQAGASIEAWMLEVRDDGSPTVDLVVVSSRGLWRSGEVHLPPRPLLADQLDLTPVASLDLADRADVLHLDGTTLWLESRDGRREVRLHDDRLTLGDLRGWSTLDRTWTERPLPVSPAVPVLFAPSGDRRLELRATPHGDSTHLRWWVARAGGDLPLAEPVRATGRWIALESWPLRSSTWVVLSETERGCRLMALHLPLRSAPSPRARAETAEASARVWVQGGPADPSDFPRDRWSLWVRSHTGVSLARRGAAGPTARGEPDVAFRALDGGQVWEITVPTLSAHEDAPAVTPRDWERALAARLGGTIPGAYSWLVEPLTGAIRVASGRLRMEFDRPVPDLVERLAHPALALDDPTLARRFATHRWESGALVPWHRGPVIELRSDVPATLGPALRRVPLDSVHGVELSRAEGPTDAMLLCSAAAPVELRRRLAWALRGIGVEDLLALDDPALTPVAPASRRPLSDVWGAVSPPAGPMPRVGFLPIARGDDPDGELALAQRRLEILLPARGIEVVPSSVSRREGVVLTQLVRLALYSGDPLLRSLELASWAGGGPDPERSRQATMRPLDHEDRTEVAREVERALLLDGALVPLWTEPGRLRPDASLSRVGPWLEGLPAMLWEVEVAPAPAPEEVTQ